MGEERKGDPKNGVVFENLISSAGYKISLSLTEPEYSLSWAIESDSEGSSVQCMPSFLILLGEI